MSLDYLKKKNVHERDANISFKEEGHEYTVCGKKGFTSVTTWIHTLFEKFDADKIINNMMKSSKWSENKYYGMTKSEIKELWNKNGQEASSAGTRLHYDIECTYNDMQVTNDSIEYAYFLEFYKKYGDF